MPLPLLLLLVGGGIGSIALLLHFLGKSAPVVLTNDTTRIAWLRLFPDDTITDITISGDGHAALVSTNNGTGLVWSFGIDTVARYLSDARISETKKHLKIQFRDFTAPKASIALTETERANWRQKMVLT